MRDFNINFTNNNEDNAFYSILFMNDGMEINPEQWVDIHINKSANYKIDLSNVSKKVDMVHVYIHVEDDTKITFLDSPSASREFIIHNHMVILDDYLPKIQFIFEKMHGFSFKAPTMFSYCFDDCKWSFMELTNNI